MQDQTSGNDTCTDTANFETRVAIDVMFEALSHIQASIDTSCEEDRVESYRKFKEALYERYEHLLEKRREEKTDAPNHPEAALERQVNGNGHANDGAADTNGTSDTDDDTLGKLWPTISEKNDSIHPR